MICSSLLNGLLSHGKLLLQLHVLDLEHRALLSFLGKCFAHRLELLLLLGKSVAGRFLLLLYLLELVLEHLVVLCKPFQLLSHLLKCSFFNVDLRLHVGDGTLKVGLQGLFLFFKLLLNTADLQLGVRCCLRCLILVIRLVLLHCSVEFLFSFLNLAAQFLLVLFELIYGLLKIRNFAVQLALELFNALQQALFLVLDNQALLARLVPILSHLGHHLRRFVPLSLQFTLQLLVLLVERLNHACMLLDFSLVLMLEPLHLFLEEAVLLVELFVCAVDLQRLLNLFLHVVAVLLQLGDHLLLGVCTLFRGARLLFELFLEVFHFLLMTLCNLGQLLACQT